MQDTGIWIGETPAGVKWICYEPDTLEMMKAAFERVCRYQMTTSKTK